jgi:hypothetical protein
MKTFLEIRNNTTTLCRAEFHRTTLDFKAWLARPPRTHPKRSIQVTYSLKDAILALRARASAQPPLLPLAR